MKLNSSPFAEDRLSVRDRAGIMVERMFDALMMTNGKGFRQPSEKSNRYRQPTWLEAAMFRAGLSDEDPHKTNSRLTSTRGYNRRWKEAKARRRMVHMQKALQNFRQQPGIHHLTKMSDVPQKERAAWLKDFAKAEAEA